ncbi:PLD nuclease N-terminal domain-containing protein [Leucobacter iarius]|uniref:Cardiolipin synthase N-terminal domain-containing protein n=1 Tax=Leucobacter iarius TaxID=333963 RepID=A0ABP4XEH0_9MICO
MVRVAIIGVVVAVAFTLYALIDAAMSEPSRSRGVSKPVWVVLTVVLPVIGGILWFTIGKGQPQPARPAARPDDDPRFTATRLTHDQLDDHMRELEDRLRELDAETFPGEPPAVDVPDPTRDTEPERTGNQAPDAPEPGAGDPLHPRERLSGTDLRPDDPEPGRK